MRRPSVLLRRNPSLNKRDFGHVLVVAGSARMLGACALSSLAAMRAGAGLVTAAVAQSLNLSLQKKISPVIMTYPLRETRQGAISLKAFTAFKRDFPKYDAAVIGPGLGLAESTARFVCRMVKEFPGPMVVDADALNILAQAKDHKLIARSKGVLVLTPHEGEMVRLISKPADYVASHRREVAKDFALQHNCIVILKGHRTVIASSTGKIRINKTGNVGMATAGSGDVLSGIIAAYLAQGIEPYQAACLAVEDHGKAGDLAAKKRSRSSLIATDIIEVLS